MILSINHHTITNLGRLKTAPGPHTILFLLLQAISFFTHLFWCFHASLVFPNVTSEDPIMANSHLTLRIVILGLAGVYLAANMALHFYISGFKSSFFEDSFFSCIAPFNFVRPDIEKTRDYLLFYIFTTDAMNILLYLASLLLPPTSIFIFLPFPLFLPYHLLFMAVLKMAAALYFHNGLKPLYKVDKMSYPNMQEYENRSDTYPYLLMSYSEYQKLCNLGHFYSDTTLMQIKTTCYYCALEINWKQSPEMCSNVTDLHHPFCVYRKEQIDIHDTLRRDGSQLSFTRTSFVPEWRGLVKGATDIVVILSILIFSIINVTRIVQGTTLNFFQRYAFSLQVLFILQED